MKWAKFGYEIFVILHSVNVTLLLWGNAAERRENSFFGGGCCWNMLHLHAMLSKSQTWRTDNKQTEKIM